MTPQEFENLRELDWVWMPSVVSFSRTHGIYDGDMESSETSGPQKVKSFPIYDWYAVPNLVNAIHRESGRIATNRCLGLWKYVDFFLTKKECEDYILSRPNRRLADLTTYNDPHPCPYAGGWAGMGNDIINSITQAMLKGAR